MFFLTFAVGKIKVSNFNGTCLPFSTGATMPQTADISLGGFKSYGFFIFHERGTYKISYHN